MNQSDNRFYREKADDPSAEIETLRAEIARMRGALSRCIGSLAVVSPGGETDPDVVFAKSALAGTPASAPLDAAAIRRQALEDAADLREKVLVVILELCEGGRQNPFNAADRILALLPAGPVMPEKLSEQEQGNG